MAELKVDIITPAKKTFSGSAVAVTVPGTVGSFQILADHAPILSTFEIGLIKVESTDKSVKLFATSGGTIEVMSNNVKILADSLEPVEDIDVERAKQAAERAKDRLVRKHEEGIDAARAEAALARALNRIKIAEKYKTSEKAV